jgi:hypothetical protein
MMHEYKGWSTTLDGPTVLSLPLGGGRPSTDLSSIPST